MYSLDVRLDVEYYVQYDGRVYSSLKYVSLVILDHL